MTLSVYYSYRSIEYLVYVCIVPDHSVVGGTRMHLYMYLCTEGLICIVGTNALLRFPLTLR